MTIQKDKFAFSKGVRFGAPKVLNQQISYEPKMSDFERVIRTSPTRPMRPGMGGTSSRFDYYSSRRKHGALPSS